MCARTRWGGGSNHIEEQLLRLNVMSRRECMTDVQDELRENEQEASNEGERAAVGAVHGLRAVFEARELDADGWPIIGANEGEGSGSGGGVAMGASGDSGGFEDDDDLQ